MFASSSSKKSASNSSFSYRRRSFNAFPNVSTPSVTRSSPSISAIGGTSGFSRSAFVTISLRSTRAAMIALVGLLACSMFPVLPSACIKSRISASSSSFFFGGPVNRFTVFCPITRATATVVSSPGFWIYRSSHALLKSAVSREAESVSFVHFNVYSAIFSQVQPCRSRISPAPA